MKLHCIQLFILLFSVNIVSGDKSMWTSGDSYDEVTIAAVKDSLKWIIDGERQQGKICLGGIFRDNKFPAGTNKRDYEAEVVSEMFDFNRKEWVGLSNGNKLALAVRRELYLSEIKKNNMITTVDLSDNGITDDYALRFVPVLNSILSLNLSDNELSKAVKLKFVRTYGERVIV